MFDTENLKKMHKELTELKLQERRVSCDIRTLVKANRMIDFYQAKKLNVQRQGLKSEIKNVESKITPNIIA